jgi:hypothetical protein
MSSNGQVHRRRTDQLPRELTQVNSDLDVFIRIAGESADHKTFGFQSNTNLARRLIKQQCGEYRPAKNDRNRLLCHSGELDGTPKRGDTCLACRVSQFSRSGFFTGEENHSSIADVMASPRVIAQSIREAVIEDRQMADQGFSDLVNASEDCA